MKRRTLTTLLKSSFSAFRTSEKRDAIEPTKPTARENEFPARVRLEQERSNLLYSKDLETKVYFSDVQQKWMGLLPVRILEGTTNVLQINFHADGDHEYLPLPPEVQDDLNRQREKNPSWYEVVIPPAYVPV